MSESADLRIASKRAYYDNNKPYGESETITLYIYNAGPDRAVAPTVKAGYSYSMNYEQVTTSLRQAQEWGQPSEVITIPGSLTWADLPNPSSHYEGWDMLTTLPDVPGGTLMELNLSFPMLHQSSNADYTMKASVSSSTDDPQPGNNSTTYIITPNHHDDGPDYWNTPGDVSNLDFKGLTAVVPLSQADLRVASARAYYNNDLPYGESETLTFFIFNAGPTIATQSLLKAGYTWSMDYSKVSCSGGQVWVPDGTNPSPSLDVYEWQPLDDLSCRIADWDVICAMPNIPPSVLYRIEIVFPMTHDTSYKDYTATASVSSDAAMLNPSSTSTTYIITPNHVNDGEEYWKTPGNISQLDGSSTPNGRRQIPLGDLEGEITKTQLMSYDLGQRTLLPKMAADVEYGTSSAFTVVSFSTDGKTQLSYRAHPDTMLYLYPQTVKVGQDQLRIGYWLPVRMLWVGAKVRGMSANGSETEVYVTNIHQTEGAEIRSAEPHMVSQSHSYVVGTEAAGGVLVHNPKDDQRCGNANVAAILLAVAMIASDLVATTTPAPDETDQPHGYRLRHRRTTDPPLPPPPAEPPILPADVPRRDEDGNWLIYLYEEDTPGAVENARFAVNESTGQYQSQRELLQLTTQELGGGSGSTGQLDRDEYPPAIAHEGGAGAVVTYIEAGDNRRAGSLMGQQFNNYRMDPQPDGHRPLQQGDTFRFAIIHRNMAGVEYLGDDLSTESQIERPPTD
ncbi:hypothetical protein J7T55_007944 [Diaporthe amygdali]|uniref:uncharacterized protein n=1 Tax=Phomopsis amygdali TaxID=1214568 RepID=UPI0022FDDBB4|nr:uncharacterized protein J7T55_007944 [Diaporthe amygdali]KAJ0114110.1 hypothetical protein J7T55_007944 [Diaporthe amygdali]